MRHVQMYTSLHKCLCTLHIHKCKVVATTKTLGLPGMSADTVRFDYSYHSFVERFILKNYIEMSESTSIYIECPKGQCAKCKIAICVMPLADQAIRAAAAIRCSTSKNSEQCVRTRCIHANGRLHPQIYPHIPHDSRDWSSCWYT